jgi:hypothetical protein
MKTRLTLRPGRNGTKAMTRKYGARLIAVRYIYDEAARRRYKTVELIEDVVLWVPPALRGRYQWVTVLVDPHDRATQDRLVLAGAWRSPDRSGARDSWELDYATAVRMGLKDRIVREEMAVYVVVRLG